MKPVFVLLTVLLTSLILRTGAEAQQPPSEPCASLPCAVLQERQQAIELKLRDWPDLARYREDDARLGPPAKGESRVVFLGDSITQLWSLPGSFPGKPYVNRGISGQTTPQILLRFRQDVIALQPAVVVILAGTNDIAENTGPTTLAAIEDNMTSMVELAKRNGIRVVMASLLPAFRYSWRPDLAPVEKIGALNDWIKDYAAKEGLVFLDYFSAMADDRRGLKADLSVDGVHPNKAGYAVMAPLAEKAVAAALSKN